MHHYLVKKKLNILKLLTKIVAIARFGWDYHYKGRWGDEVFTVILCNLTPRSGRHFNYREITGYGL